MNYGGFVSEEQLEWLHSTCSNFDRQSHLRHIVVMGHHPLYDTTP
ncbi:MAG: hypothetical protein AAFY57_05550 [Cyanobacteria bacterium J06642_2]